MPDAHSKSLLNPLGFMCIYIYSLEVLDPLIYEGMIVHCLGISKNERLAMWIDICLEKSCTLQIGTDRLTTLSSLPFIMHVLFAQSLVRPQIF